MNIKWVWPKKPKQKQKQKQNLRNFCTSNETVTRVQRLPMEWEKLFTQIQLVKGRNYLLNCMGQIGLNLETGFKLFTEQRITRTCPPPCSLLSLFVLLSISSHQDGASSSQ